MQHASRQPSTTLVFRVELDGRMMVNQNKVERAMADLVLAIYPEHVRHVSVTYEDTAFLKFIR